MTRHISASFILLIGVLLLLPSIALASFPDFGPFEQQTRYLEAGFGIAQNFFDEAAGKGKNGKTLQYLCLTAALVGAAMVIFRKKNQAMGVLVPWIVLVFIMLAGPTNSKLVFVSAESPQEGGLLAALMPESIIQTNQVGFAPQVLSIHVMSTLHRLFYDYFESNGIKNVVNAMAARQEFNSLDNLEPGRNAMSALENASSCIDAAQTASAESVSDAFNYSGVTTFLSGVNQIREQASSLDPNDTTIMAPILKLPINLNELPESQRAGYISILNGLTGMNMTYGDPSLETDYKHYIEDAVFDVIDTASDMGIGPDSPFHYITADDYGQHEGLEHRGSNMANSGIGQGAYFGDYNTDLGVLSSILNLPVVLEQVTMNGALADIADTGTCGQALNLALEALLSDSLTSSGIDPTLKNLLMSAVQSGEIVTPEQMQPFASDDGETGILARKYIDDIAAREGSAEQKWMMFQSEILNKVIQSYNTPSSSGKPGMKTKLGSSFVNGVSQGFVGFSKPIIQLLSPFIMAFSVMVLEFMKIIIDMALMGIVIVTPIAFIMGLLIPSYALGVMTLVTLCVLVLKMVPVTFTITDAIFSIMYTLLDAGATDGTPDMVSIAEYLNPIKWVIAAAGKVFDIPTFEQTLLMFAASGVYTSLVGLSLFILFKIGDPSSVSQLASIDGAAKKMAALPAKMAMAAATIAAGGGALAAMGAAGSLKGDGAGGGNQLGGATKAAEDVARKEMAANGDMSEEERAEFMQNRTDELLADDAAELQNLAQTDAAMKELIDQSYGDGSGGLSFDDFGKRGIGQRGALSNALRTGASEAKEFAASAAGSMLPGGGGAVLKEASNARREGQARTEARRGLARKSENEERSNIGESLANAQGLDWASMSTSERDDFILSNASAINNSMSGSAYDLGALKKADYDNDVNQYRNQFGGVLAGSEASKIGGQSVMRNSLDQGKSQAGQLWSGSQASYEMHGINGMSSGQYAIAHSLQAREAAADLKQASISNAKITGDEIAAKVERASDAKVNSYNQEGRATASTDLQIAADTISGNMTADAKMELIKADKASYEAAVTEGRRSGKTEEQVRDSLQGSNMYARYDKLKSNAATDVMRREFVAQKAQEYEKSISGLSAISSEQKSKLKGDYEAKLVADLDSKDITLNNTQKDFQKVVDSSVRDGIVAEFALQDAKAVMSGGSASKFMVTGAMQSKLGDASYFRAQRFDRRAGRNQFAADDMSTTEFFAKDTQTKYNKGKISLADHHISASIEKSADGVSSLKSSANAIRRMGDMEWEHHNKLKEIEMETQFRGRIASGRRQSISARTNVIVDEAIEQAENYQERSARVTVEQKIIGRDEAGNVKRFGDQERASRIYANARKIALASSKAAGEAGATIAETSIREVGGVNMQHDNSVHNINSTIAKMLQSENKGMSRAEATEMANVVQSMFQNVTPEKVYMGNLKISDKKTGGTAAVSQLNLSAVKKAAEAKAKKGDKAAQETLKFANNLEKYVQKDMSDNGAQSEYAMKNGRLYAQAGFSYVEDMSQEAKKRYENLQDNQKQQDRLAWKNNPSIGVNGERSGNS